MAWISQNDDALLGYAVVVKRTVRFSRPGEDEDPFLTLQENNIFLLVDS